MQTELISKQETTSEVTTLNISENSITLPSFLGANLFQAKTLIDELGLELGNITYDDSEYINNLVLEQSINPGTTVSPGDKINLKVSATNPIRFLPAIFQSNDLKNNNVLKRYLWIFYDIINNVGLKLDNLHNFFDPLNAPTDFFKWLASWFSINLEYSIPEEKMRLLVKEAIKLYRWRGTAIGISSFLEIITGVRPEIIEDELPVSEYIIEKDKFVERPILEKNNSPYNFTVSFPVAADYFESDVIKKINQVIKAEKPANASYYIAFAKPEKIINNKQTSFIGADTIK